MINLLKFDESSKTYEKGIRFASKYLGKNHHLVENLKETLNISEKEVISFLNNYLMPSFAYIGNRFKLKG